MILAGDYKDAVIHLAWNLDDIGARTLLFACVELLPAEVPPPIDDYDLDRSRRRLGSASKHHVYVRHLITSADAALRWYADCRNGTARRFDKNGNFNFDDPSLQYLVAPLVEEPRWPELVCDSETEFPFTAPWHLSPRLHHLLASQVPMETWTAKERARAVDWLKTELFFDFDLFPELWGSVHLVAPNPRLRDIRMRRDPGRDDGDAAVVELTPRAGHSPDGLRLTVREDRPTGTFELATVIASAPRIRVRFGHETSKFSICISDDKRGLLYVGRPHVFLSQLALTLGLVSATREVVVPAKRKRKEDRYNVSVIRGSETNLTNPQHQPNVATTKLIGGHYARKERRLAADLDQTWFDGDADAAAEFIRDLIRPAQRSVLIVDPYFTATELRRFVLAASDSRVPIEILTSVEGLTEVSRREGTKGTAATRANEMASELARLLAVSHANPIEVRLMLGRPEIHDRFLVVDDRTWSLGASLNELGARGCLLLKVPHPAPVIEKLRAAWIDARKLSAWLEEKDAES